ncbi:hypothetical protein HHK36_012635 [Tetracentron sinense]|uniref:Uncharacterized protein n=1 Tax=Tetracentron sinense TaxID=13715 RepID=A0A835DIU9_TETSI|nr:hypothetical protein HHK36_012635 [Tetracentron sinense]
MKMYPSLQEDEKLPKFSQDTQKSPKTGNGLVGWFRGYKGYASSGAEAKRDVGLPTHFFKQHSSLIPVGVGLRKMAVDEIPEIIGGLVSLLAKSVSKDEEEPLPEHTQNMLDEEKGVDHHHHGHGWELTVEVPATCSLRSIR